MPCYTVQTLSVQFTAKHQDILETAIVKLGFDYEILQDGTISIQDGRIVLDLEAQTATLKSSEQDLLNQIKQRYSFECVSLAAQYKGWSLQQTYGEAEYQGTLSKQTWS